MDYSTKYYDSVFEYRHVTLNPDIYNRLPKDYRDFYKEAAVTNRLKEWEENQKAGQTAIGIEFPQRLLLENEWREVGV